MTGIVLTTTIVAMAFGRKRNKQEAPQQQSAPESQASTPWQSHSGGSSGYVVSELPYYDKGKRKIMVYTSDATGKIIKTFKK